MIKLFKPFVAKSLALRNLEECFKSGQLAEGQKVLEFEAELAKKFGVSPENVITTNSCTSALHLCLERLNRYKGYCRVLSTPLTCAATNMAVEMSGIARFWADIDETFNIDLDYVENRIGYLEGLVYVNWGGNPIDLDRLEEIGEKYKKRTGERLFVVEDAAHSWADSVKPRKSDNLIHYTCFSTQAIKYLTTGDGGFIIVPEGEDPKPIRNMRWFGLDRTKGGFRSGQDITEWGYKYHMNDIAAAIGLANLPFIDENVRKQKENTQYLKDNLGDIIKFVPTKNSSSWLCTVLVDNRNEFIGKLAEKRIESNPVHTRNDKLSCFKYNLCELPFMDKVEEKYTCIPAGYWLTKDDLDYVIKSIKEIL